MIWTTQVILRDRSEDQADAAPEPDENGDIDVSGPLESESVATLQRFYKVVRERVADSSTLVRRTACQILCALLINVPDHEDTLPICMEMLSRIEDSMMIRNKILSTFESIYFQHGVPSPSKAVQLAQLVNASRYGVGAVTLLKAILNRFKSQLKLRAEKLQTEFDVTGAYDKRLRDLTHVLYQALQSEAVTSLESAKSHEIQTSIMHTLVALSEIEPSSLVEHAKGLCTFLALDGPPHQSKQDVEMAGHVLDIMYRIILILFTKKCFQNIGTKSLPFQHYFDADYQA